jgi:hypothetical protein
LGQQPGLSVAPLEAGLVQLLLRALHLLSFLGSSVALGKRRLDESAWDAGALVGGAPVSPLALAGATHYQRGVGPPRSRMVKVGLGKAAVKDDHHWAFIATAAVVEFLDP